MVLHVMLVCLAVLPPHNIILAISGIKILIKRAYIDIRLSGISVLTHGVHFVILADPL